MELVADIETRELNNRDYWIPLNRWLDALNVSSVTAWRWRRKGWLKVVRVGGRLFIRPEDLAEFQRRAAAGEFTGARRTSAD